MQLSPVLIEALRALVSRPARSRLAARTAIWIVAGALLAISLVFALIGLHAVLAKAMDPVTASFVIALALGLAAGLLGLGAWLAAPPRHARKDPHDEALLLVIGFLEGLAGQSTARGTDDRGSTDRDH